MRQSTRACKSITLAAGLPGFWISDVCLNTIDRHSDHGADAAHGMSKPAIAGCLLLSLCGCTSMVPQRLAAVDVPATWSGADQPAARGNPSLVQWWSRFNDPLLSDLVAQALKANTSVQEAQAALREARALRDVAAAALWPTLDAAASRRLATHSRC